MTEKEAIDKIRNTLFFCVESRREEHTGKESENDLYIAMKMAIEALQKQELMEPTRIKRHRGGFKTMHCPTCETDYQIDARYTVTDEYCPDCGKLLDSAFRNFCGNCGKRIDRGEGGRE